MNLECWKCGASVEDLPMPLGRREECPNCNADLHVCRQCTFYDKSAPQSCREPVADEVKDKDRANFCGYFTLNPDGHSPVDNAAAASARAQLDALFGNQPAEPTDSTSGPLDEAERARRELESLFGMDQTGGKGEDQS